MQKKHLTKFNTLMIETLRKLRIEGNFVNLMNSYRNLQLTLYLMVKECFTPNIRNKAMISTVNIILAV